MSNSSNTTSTSRGGVGFASLLTLLFIGLKLGGVITWSWIWVLSPLWISFALGIAVLVVIGIILGIVYLVDAGSIKKRSKIQYNRKRF